MSDKNKNRKTRTKAFFRYHRDKLSVEERNAFERELQKDLFTEEAAEGFELIRPEEASMDLSVLRSRLIKRISGRRSFIIYRIAASIAVLVAISVIFILTEKNKTSKNIAVNSEQSPIEFEITRANPITGAGPNEVPSESVKATKKAADALKKYPDAGKNEDTFKIQDVSERINENVSEIREEPAGAKTAKARSVAPAKDKTDSLAEPPVGALSEVVITDYKKKSDSDRERNNSEYRPPQPVNGQSEFDKYIRNNIHRPGNANLTRKVVVIISFSVKNDGTIDSIMIIRSPDKLFSDEAIRLIKSGPAWNPAIENGKAIEDNVRLRIIFR